MVRMSSLGNFPAAQVDLLVFFQGSSFLGPRFSLVNPSIPYLYVTLRENEKPVLCLNGVKASPVVLTFFMGIYSSPLLTQLPYSGPG